MLAPLLAVLLLQSAVPPAAPAEDEGLTAVADRYSAARELLLQGRLTEAAAAFEAILADPGAEPFWERAVILARLARELAARGRFVPAVPVAGTGAAPPDRGGRAELVLFSTVYGVYAAGATVLSADVQNGRTIATLLLVGGGTGLGASLWGTRAGPMTSGRANAIDSAALWAGYNGTLIGIVGEANLRVAAGISLASSAAGLATATLLTREVSPRVGTVAAANSGGIWGLAAGALLASTFPSEPDLDAVLLTLLATADAGIVAGGWLGERYAVSRERALLVDAGAVVGLLAGLAVYGIVQPEAREAGGLLGLAGLGAGLGTAIWATRGWDEARATAAAAPHSVGPWIAPRPGGGVALGLAGRF